MPMKFQSPEQLLQWMIDSNIVTTRFSSKYQEQIIEITEDGILMNEMLNKLREGSKACMETEKIMKQKEKFPDGPPPDTKELLQVLVKDIEDIPYGDVDRNLIIAEIKKIIKNIK